MPLAFRPLEIRTFQDTVGHNFVAIQITSYVSGGLRISQTDIKNYSKNRTPSSVFYKETDKEGCMEF